MKMSLQFDVNIRLAKTESAKNLRQALHRFERRLRPTMRESRRQRSFLPASQADQTIGVLTKIRARSASSFFAASAQLHFRNQAAEILISSARSHQQWETTFTTRLRR